MSICVNTAFVFQSVRSLHTFMPSISCTQTYARAIVHGAQRASLSCFVKSLISEPDFVPSANIISDTQIIPTSGLEMLSLFKDSDSFAWCGEQHVKAYVRSISRALISPSSRPI
jgi:hypothetical protein